MIESRQSYSKESRVQFFGPSCISNRFRLKLTSLRTAGTHDPIQQVEFMNAPKLYLLKRDH